MSTDEGKDVDNDGATDVPKEFQVPYFPPHATAPAHFSTVGLGLNGALQWRQYLAIVSTKHSERMYMESGGPVCLYLRPAWLIIDHLTIPC